MQRPLERMACHARRDSAYAGGTPLALMATRQAVFSKGPFLAESVAAAMPHIAVVQRRSPRLDAKAAAAAAQISVCSDISRASSTSMPRYLTVDSSLECPSNSCTARRFFVRR
jgi:hypothetical protein